jgi:hypothetical protein
MKNKCRLIIILLSFIGLASCSSVPTPQSHKSSSQLEIEAAQHWQVLAQDVAKQTISAMVADPLWTMGNIGSGNLLDQGGSGDSYDKDSTPSYIGVAMSGGIPSIYLQTNDLSNFGRTFRNCLITEITKLGYPIAHSPEDAVIARWSVNKVHHNADRSVSHTEIVLTFTVSKDAKVLSRQTQAYYVRAEDFNHYNNITDYAGQNYAGQESNLRPVKFAVTN